MKGTKSQHPIHKLKFNSSFLRNYVTSCIRNHVSVLCQSCRLVQYYRCHCYKGSGLTSVQLMMSNDRIMSLLTSIQFSVIISVKLLVSVQSYDGIIVFSDDVGDDVTEHGKLSETRTTVQVCSLTAGKIRRKSH